MSFVAWNYDRLVREAHRRPHFDFSFVHPSQVNGGQSRIPIRCRVCGYDRYAKVRDIFGGSGNCIQCSGMRPWTLHRLLTEGVQRWPTTDFSRVREEEVKRCKSKITVGCRVCGDWRSVTIECLVAGYGCLACKGIKHWTLQRLLTEGAQRWPTTDFSRLREEDVPNSDTKIIVGCRVCGYWRYTKIHLLVTGHFCTNCNGTRRWTLQRLVTEGAQRWPTMNFSQLREEDVVDSGTHIRVGCYVCGHWMYKTIDGLVMGHGCPVCRASKGEKTINEILAEATEIAEATGEGDVRHGRRRFRLLQHAACVVKAKSAGKFQG